MFSSRPEVSAISVRNEEENGIKERAPDRAGVNIYKTLIPNAGYTTVKFAVHGTLSLTGALEQVFTEGANRAMDLSLSALEHLRQTMAITDTGSTVANNILQNGRWTPSYLGNGAQVETAIVLDYENPIPGILQPTLNDLNLVANTIYNYFRGFNYGVSIVPQTQPFPHFPGTPTQRRSEADSELLVRSSNDLQGQQVCAHPIDIRPYFEDVVPIMTQYVAQC